MEAGTTTPECTLPTWKDEPRSAAKRAEYTIDALKRAIESPGEHRLFRWGKLPGLFPSRVGDSGNAATQAIREGLLEVTRSELRGKLVVEWVQATPRALEYVHDHDSPRAVLREIRSVLGATSSAIPAWMEAARDEAAQLALRFEHRAREMLERLEKISDRVETALRRIDTRPGLGESMARLVPWGVAALEYLDRWTDTIAGDCPLPDLFRALEVRFPDLTLPAYQDGLRRLHDARAIRLIAAKRDAITEPEFAFVIEKQMVWYVRR